MTRPVCADSIGGFCTCWWMSRILLILAVVVALKPDCDCATFMRPGQESRLREFPRSPRNFNCDLRLRLRLRLRFLTCLPLPGNIASRSNKPCRASHVSLWQIVFASCNSNHELIDLVVGDVDWTRASSGVHIFQRQLQSH